MKCFPWYHSLKSCKHPLNFSEGKALTELAFNNKTLRDALIATTESVAVGIHVENWSAYRLWQPEYEMEKGRTYSEEAAKLAGTLPGIVSFP